MKDLASRLEIEMVLEMRVDIFVDCRFAWLIKQRESRGIYSGGPGRGFMRGSSYMMESREIEFQV